MVPLMGLSRGGGGGCGPINWFIKSGRFVVTLTTLSRGGGLWSH